MPFIEIRWDKILANSVKKFSVVAWFSYRLSIKKTKEKKKATKKQHIYQYVNDGIIYNFSGVSGGHSRWQSSDDKPVSALIKSYL